jgi:putative salt-induced outer membrane protein
MVKTLTALFAILLAFPFAARAEDPTPSASPKVFQSESEAGVVTVSGNSSSESYTFKSNNTYTLLDKNIFTLGGHYLRTTANGVESARNWDVNVRYERALNDYFGLFVGHKAESDVYAGYIQRDSEDLGAKYNLLKNDVRSWSVEAGYRYSKTKQTDNTTKYDSFGRLYTEYNQAVDKTLSFKYWIEYLPNFTDSHAYLLNTEASLGVMLSQIFSLKLAYLLQYQNLPPNNGKYVDTTYTTSLVAKF